MVDYMIWDVDINTKVSIRSFDDIKDRDVEKQFDRTHKNLVKMLEQERKCKVVVPDRPLEKNEIEEYRKFFCKKAKEDGVNYIYFSIPVTVGV